ncbi:hypothetical protein HDU97_005369 [Phlyctochytrium planicorne]|nr:hypothetical protein HDU97_005369 [Phlyctochytrium planicorne]
MHQYFLQGNEIFYGPSESTETNAYFQDRTKDLSGEVRYAGVDRGKGMFAKASGIKKGDIIVSENPLVSMQSFSNKAFAKVCSRCLMYLDDLDVQIQHVLQRALSPSEKKLTSRIMEKCKFIQPAFRSEVPCGGTCHQLYCSEECKTADMESGHELLCSNKIGKEKLHAFLHHCEETNEVFWMAAKVFAHVSASVTKRKKTLEQALLPYRYFVKDYWWNVCEPDEGEDPEELKEILKGLVHDTTKTLCILFSNQTELQPVLTDEMLSLLMGLFEKNNVTVVTPSPLLAVFTELTSDLASEIMDRTHHLEEQGSSGDSDDDSEINPLKALECLTAEGTGLHTLHATINHSCSPNAIVYKDDSHFHGVRATHNPVYDGRAVVQAIRDIPAGEEVLVSYLDDNVHGAEDGEEEEEDEDEDERVWRAKSLREYGIENCLCSRCRRK